MALSDNRGSREFDKFVADGSGNASIRVSSTSSATTSATAGSGSATAGASSGTGTATATSETVILDSTSVEGKSRISVQIFNTGDTGDTQNAVYKVYGSLLTTPGTVGGSNWTQIGDDIQVARAANAYKAISTTPIKFIGITGESKGSTFDDAGSTPAATTTNIYLMAD
tara:strand:- start:23 stop:529 length:507 start_codon:yes stop_codon:yes gene_type:complete